MSTPTTRRVTLSDRKIAENGSRYTDHFVGLTVVWTGFDGDAHVGVVESFVNPLTGAVGYPIIRFPDGRWARGYRELSVVDPR